MRTEIVHDYDLAVYLNRGRRLRSEAVKKSFYVMMRGLGRLFHHRRRATRSLQPAE